MHRQALIKPYNYCISKIIAIPNRISLRLENYASIIQNPQQVHQFQILVIQNVHETRSYRILRPGPVRFHLTGGAEPAEVPRMLACWSSRSLSCCSRSISMMRGTTRMRKEVPKIQAALPVLLSSFLATNAASEVACLPRATIWDWEILVMTPSSSFLGFRLSGRETPPFRAWLAITEESESVWMLLSLRLLPLRFVL